jgi:hypothetical protein
VTQRRGGRRHRSGQPDGGAGRDRFDFDDPGLDLRDWIDGVPIDAN